MTAIFISYRRQDTKQIAGRIFDKLEARFGAGSVFMDTEGIPAGVDFHKFLDEAVARARIVLVLIGHGWAEAKNEAGQRRLDNPDDFVRIEVESALNRNIPAVPVLIDGAPMPPAEQLPEGMRAFLRFQAAPVDAGRDFHVHMDRLIADLERRLNGRLPKNRDRALDVRPGSGESFRDMEAPWCPEMVVAPAGDFIMGPQQSEIDALSEEYKDWLEFFKWETPYHKVTIAKSFAVGRYAITRGEFAAFVDETGRDMSGGAYILNGKEWRHDSSKSWRDPGFAQDDSHPVVCANWVDAKAYTKWLSAKTGKDYRLPSEAEWEYACRAGTTTPFWWGDSISAEQTNYNGNYSFCVGKKGEYRKRTMRVKSFQPNPWGLYQVHGNAWEWCEDLWHDNYNGAPADGSAWTTGSRAFRVLRGGSWYYGPVTLRAAVRYGINSGLRNGDAGFRLARTL
jgi:formylglycine-generating enzyme required for sulfatase activity